jgi:alpha-L-rhamnosidase
MRWQAAIVIAGLVLSFASRPCAAPSEVRATEEANSLSWPTPTREMRPWTRWWWLGSAVDRENLSRLLETYHEAGLGGVEITCLYGVEGAESRELPYLSPQWVDAVRHAAREAKRLDMGVDLPTGSGWRMGGPSVSAADGDLEVVVSGDLPTITGRWSRDNVKRPAPGGEGRNINPYSKRSLDNYLEFFGKQTDGLKGEGLRAQFHDSFEYEGNWCDDFLAQFEQRRGYRLQDHSAALAGEGDLDEVARVKCDYRETLSDMVRDNLIGPWVEWSHAEGMLARNQSHGSPSNWLDLYAACDIPETEHFGRLRESGTERLVFQFASSAAHVAGRPLASSETCTWLDEHFQETLGEMKELVDRLFLAGINHVIYHGTAYSPADAAWPGWLFYASSEINPQNPIWHDFPALNEYVTRCQSIFQSTRPDNDVLLYWPIYDQWQNPKGLRQRMQVENVAEWFFPTPFGQAAKWLEEQGYACDYISDRQLADCHVAEGRIQTTGGSYAAVVVPRAKLMPLATLRKLDELARAGATLVFVGGLPSGAPGLKGLDEQAAWDELATQMKSNPRVSESDDLQSLLAATKARCETWRKSAGLAFHRRAWSGGNVYFVKNESDQAYDGQIVPAADWRAAAIMDPVNGQIGLVDVADGSGAGIRLQLAPHQAVFVKTFREPLAGDGWSYRELAGEPTPLDGEWHVEFVSGGPELPSPLVMHRLASWTELAGVEGERFAGTARYSIKFTPDAGVDRYLLDLGAVADSARVELNGKPVATLISAPYQVEIGPLASGNNRLVVEVTNVAANRIRDLDRRGVEWKIFKDINFVDIKYKPFDASQWPVRDAGLLGPVTLTPLTMSSDGTPATPR